MSPRYVVVDGSNLATEGRSIPSLAQLDEAVRAFMVERPIEQVIVVVDASFGYRIDESERNEYEAAEAAGEIVSPPAGAIGRGDGFLLRIADRTDAVVLSNDSFQEFHAEYGWLFDQGRLIGGKPVPGVGWIFTPRAPVRGPRSREALRLAKRAQRTPRRATVAEGPVAEAIAEATKEVIAPDDAEAETEDAAATDDAAREGGRRSGPRRRHSKPAGSVNDPFPFIQFIADHPLGTEVTGEVDSFTSHGAFVQVEGARCYVPLVALGDPPPRSAKSVLTRGEVRSFVVQALDPPRRGIELALPELARVAGTPTEETVEADIGAGRKPRKSTTAPPAPALAAASALEPVPEPMGEPTPAKARRSRKKAAPVEAVAEPVPVPEPAPAPAAARKSSRKKAVAAVAAPPPEPAPALAPESMGEPVPAKARRSRQKAAPVEAAPEPAPPAPAPAKKSSRKKAAPPVAPVAAVETPAPPAAPVKQSRARKAPAAAATPPAEPAPAAAPVKRSRARKSAG